MRAILLAVCVMSTGCVVASGGHDEVQGVDEDAEGYGAESVSSAVPAGTSFKTTADLNLRASASTSASILAVATKGTTVTATTGTPSSGFYQVKLGAKTGWMYGAYLDRISTGGGSTPPSGGSDTWSCSGSYGTSKMSSGSYYLTAFGCWTDASGGKHGDSGDNCIPGCLAKAKSAGVCKSSETGKQCEERVSWYVADAGRFGCNAKVKVTNPSNGRSVVAVVLDYGPSCYVERSVSHAALDASGRVNRYLFGADQGAVDRAKVQVVEVDASTPLGPS